MLQFYHWSVITPIIWCTIKLLILSQTLAVVISIFFNTDTEPLFCINNLWSQYQLLICIYDCTATGWLDDLKFMCHHAQHQYSLKENLKSQRGYVWKRTQSNGRCHQNTDGSGSYQTLDTKCCQLFICSWPNITFGEVGSFTYAF